MIEKFLIKILKKCGYVVLKRDDFVSKRVKLLDDTVMHHERITKKSTWAAINPVIRDLENLRADTWDQDKITHIQKWLKDNFEVKK